MEGKGVSAVLTSSVDWSKNFATSRADLTDSEVVQLAIRGAAGKSFGTEDTA